MLCILTEVLINEYCIVLYCWSQSINKHVSVELDCVHKSAHRRVTGNAVLALHYSLCLKNKSFSSPSFSSRALSSVIFQSCIFQPCTFVRHFPVLHFPPPWFLRSAIFQSCIFRRPIMPTGDVSSTKVFCTKREELSLRKLIIMYWLIIVLNKIS